MPQPFFGSMISVIVVMLSFLPCPALGADDDSAVVDRYREAWLTEERAAASAEERVVLSARLLEAAREAAKPDPAYAGFICRRAFLVGREQPESFATATDALALMTQLDPSQNLEALELAAQLYNSAYERDPVANYKLGIKAVEATALLAKERHALLEQQIRGGDLDPAQLLVESNRIVREWQQTGRKATGVIRAAQRSHKAHPA